MKCSIYSGDEMEIMVENKQISTMKDGKFNPNTSLMQL
jgi:hypothetical protein